MNTHLLFSFGLQYVARWFRHANGLFGERHAFSSPDQSLISIIKINVEGKRSILHSESKVLLSRKFKHHPAVQSCPVHQPFATRFWCPYDLYRGNSGKRGQCG